MGLFLSTFQNKIDRKGRVSVPATFRAVLASQPFAGIIAYRSFTAPCIEGCGFDFLQDLSDSTQQLAAFSPEQDDFASLIFADSRQLSFDPEGRVMLPEDLIAHAEISEMALFVGKGRTFQIWHPDAYRAAEEEIRARALKSRPTLPMRPRTPSPHGAGS